MGAGDASHQVEKLGGINMEIKAINWTEIELNWTEYACDGIISATHYINNNNSRPEEVKK